MRRRHQHLVDARPFPTGVTVRRREQNVAPYDVLNAAGHCHRQCLVQRRVWVFAVPEAECGPRPRRHGDGMRLVGAAERVEDRLAAAAIALGKVEQDREHRATGLPLGSVVV